MAYKKRRLKKEPAIMPNLEELLQRSTAQKNADSTSMDLRDLSLEMHHQFGLGAVQRLSVPALATQDELVRHLIAQMEQYIQAPPISEQKPVVTTEFSVNANPQKSSVSAPRSGWLGLFSKKRNIETSSATASSTSLSSPKSGSFNPRGGGR
jgi:hypothetical protein